MAKQKEMVREIIIPSRITIADLSEVIKLIQQSTFYSDMSDVDDIDIAKSSFLLHSIPQLTYILKNFQYAEELTVDGRTALEVFGGINSQADIHLERRRTFYQTCSLITNIVESIINHLPNKYETAIARLLYIEGIPYLKAQKMLDEGYKDLYPLGGTAFNDRRKRSILAITKSLKLFGILDQFEINSGRIKKGKQQFRLQICGWTINELPMP